MDISRELKERLLTYQKNEITEHHLYRRLAGEAQNSENARILRQISDDELKHYRIWKAYTGRDVAADRWKLRRYYLLSRILGMTFAIKLMERAEEDAQEVYDRLKEVIPEIDEILHDENRHEERLVGMIDEEQLQYQGSMVLGLNDALVELLGALAGLTLALQETKLIALSALTTGIAAAMSMGASEYLSSKAEETDKKPFKASLYTGLTYFVTVIALVFPYLIFKNYYLCLAISFSVALLAISTFNFYLALTQDVSFKKRFFEMAALSFGVAAFSFGVGYALRTVLGVDAG